MLPQPGRHETFIPFPGTGAAQMMLAGVKTGVTQSVSAISQPQDSGAQTLSRSSSVCGGFPWKNWMAFLQGRDTQGGARGSIPS